MQVPVTKAMEAAYDDSQFPYSDESVMPLQNFSSFNQDENLVNSIVDDDEVQEIFSSMFFQLYVDVSNEMGAIPCTKAHNSLI